MAGAKIKKMFLPSKLFRIVDFHLEQVEPRKDQSVRKQALSPSRRFIRLARKQEIASRHPLGLFLATFHIGNLPSWLIEPGKRCFLPFAGNGRDHDGKSEGQDADESREDESEASQNPGKDPRAPKNFDAQIGRNRRPQAP